MAAPKLTHQFTLEAPVRTEDGGGGADVSWTALGTFWGALEPRSGSEDLAGLRPASRVTHRVIVRSAPVGSPQRPAPDQRLRRGDRVFAIRAITEQMPGAGHLRLDVEEGPFQ
ncbi:MAG: head-tail adaptor protein [Pseudomonadota bacterium]